MLFKGTRSRSAREIANAIEGRGGYLNAFTQEECTCYYARVNAENVWQDFDVLADVYRSPCFDTQDVEKERGVIIEEITMDSDLPQQIVEESLGAALWKNHPLGRPVTGTADSLRRIDRRALRQFKESRYVPGNTVFAFAGKVEHADCVRHVRDAMGRLGGRPLPPCRRVTPAIGQDRLKAISREIGQAHLGIGFRIFGISDRRRYALRVLNAALGENASSRLFQSLREDRGWAYSVQSSYHLFRDSGVLEISAVVDERKGVPALRLISRELGRLKTRRLDPRELARAKDYAVGQLRLGLEGTIQQLMWIGESMMTHGTTIAPEAVIDDIRRVTADDVQGFARSFLRGRRVSLAVIAPRADARGGSRWRRFLHDF
jgi:predicted Zn-dependent peptidase